MTDLPDCSFDRSLGNCNVNATHALQKKSLRNRKLPPNDSNGLQCCAQTYMQDKKRQCSWALSWDVTEPGCVKQSKPLPENRRAMWGRNCGQPSTRPPFLGRPARYAALGPGHLCISARLGDPCLASQDTSKNPPSPSGDLGLSCQGPATQTAPSGQGRNSERSRRVKESKCTFFFEIH